MKNLALFTFVLSIGYQTLACDGYLKIQHQDPRRNSLYARDCAIQDRFDRVKRFYAVNSKNINDVAEYRLIRFFDRNSLEKAKNNRTEPQEIYDPAPETWNVWSNGINSLFGDDVIPFVLFKSKGFNANTPGFEHINFQTININLLKNQYGNISRDHLARVSERTSEPGTYRQFGDEAIGFWAPNDPQYQSRIERSQNSMRALQLQWEKDYGMPFSRVVENAGGINSAAATFGVTMNIGTIKSNKMYVAYSPAELVPQQMTWITAFVNASIARYSVGKPLMPPIEFAAFVQKWFVTIHPFSDGNGRTSRAIQDYILATFKMPFAPGGDLQNDALEEYDRYIDNTYAKTEALLTKLENCMSLIVNRKKLPYECKTVQELN